jgi:hypothetical protein
MRSGAALPLIVALLLVSGCAHTDSTDNSLLPSPPSSSPLPSDPPPIDPTPDQPIVTTTTASPSPTGFPDGYVQPCNGTPTGAQVIALVRRQPNLLPTGATVTVQSGPTCTGKWQYTVLIAGDREPLQVVTKGVPPSITFVTAGTDVCTVDVRANAPVSLLDLANC